MTRRKNLTDEQVRAMREDRRKTYLTIRQIAARYGCPYWTAVDILYYRSRPYA